MENLCEEIHMVCFSTKYKRELNSLNHAKARCYNKNHKDYHYYGGRGIKVCDRWLKTSVNFIEDMGGKPTKNHTLDRINNDGDYSPENCKWATRQEQSLNRRAKGACKYIGVKYHKATGKWYGSVYYKGKYLFYKLFETPRKAAIGRNNFIFENNLPHKTNDLS